MVIFKFTFFLCLPDKKISGKRQWIDVKEVLAIRRIFSLVDMITNTIFSNCPNVFKIGVVWQ